MRHGGLLPYGYTPSTRAMELEQYQTVLHEITRTMIYTFSVDVKPFRADDFRYSTVIIVKFSVIKRS